jgi:hypothetical protein
MTQLRYLEGQLLNTALSVHIQCSYIDKLEVLQSISHAYNDQWMKSRQTLINRSPIMSVVQREHETS